ncbi:hypothetical protein KAR91_32360 [Candidatus Pacearchaeota archaeon]|nr:hypothetical protein [Candidatus Pacearchaeota archaeon]
MASEIKISFSDSFNLYAVIRDQTNLVWYIVGQVFEVWGTVGRDADDYDIQLTSDAGGLHVGNFDTNIVTAGEYILQAFIDTGIPADGNDGAGSERMWWDGSAEQTQTEFELNAYGTASLSKQITITDLLEADKVIDTDSDPWVLEYRHKDTKAVLLRQTMKNTAGEDVTTKYNTTLGQLELE